MKRAQPTRPSQSLYAILGEERLSKAKAKRGSLHWREPRPPSVTGYAGATFPPGKENLMSSGGRTAERSDGEKEEPLLMRAAPPSVTGYAGATFPRASIHGWFGGDARLSLVSSAIRTV